LHNKSPQENGKESDSFLHIKQFCVYYQVLLGNRRLFAFEADI